MTQDYPWRKLYEAAMLELDRIKLQERIAAAHAALQRRTEELILADCPNTDSLEERQAISDALHSLRTLEKIELGSLAIPGRQRSNLSFGELS